MGSCRTNHNGDPFSSSSSSSSYFTGDHHGPDSDMKIGGFFEILMTFGYFLSTQSGDAVRFIVIMYALVVILVFFAFLFRSAVVYIRDIYHTYKISRFRAEATTGDPAMLTLWAVVKLLLTGIVFPIPVSILWPLWLPVVLISALIHTMGLSLSLTAMSAGLCLTTTMGLWDRLLSIKTRLSEWTMRTNGPSLSDDDDEQQ
jgi:hypothetical protein